ncbi:thioredoxin [Irregularibacter muris]|uniref:Thioredoxin n=1 Tax=Irregularibacter muris TaxID=1796619 RepID=A0AAE3HFC6_9FIRM|nr:thioredoxin [Irregularibacter muris]MCR1899545.1 thioredoxin [Irregularibacter muris]
MANEKVVIITQDNFEQEVEKSDQPVLVDFWAEWCGPCQMVGPIIDDLAGEYDGKAKVAKLNVDEQKDLARKFRVMSIPSVLFFKDGKEVDRLVGAQDKSQYASKLDSLL